MPHDSHNTLQQLATSGMADIFYSPDLHDVSRLFAPPVTAYGRAVIIIRDPIERAMAQYRYLKENNHQAVKDMSLEEFANSDYLQDNVLTNAIAGRKELTIAKEILKRKVVVGLFDRIDESLQRFETFFNWNVNDSANDCQRREVDRRMEKEYNKVNMDEDRAAYASLMAKNELDMELYEYARFLYDYQGHSLFGVSAALA